jgi:hypothetical protein
LVGFREYFDWIVGSGCSGAGRCYPGIFAQFKHEGDLPIDSAWGAFSAATIHCGIRV